MIRNIGAQSSVFNQYLAEIRDSVIQTDPIRFRTNMERMASIFAYEISKELAYEVREVTTPLGVAEVPELKEYPVVATILRAGLPMHRGMLNIFDRSENAFVSAYRKHRKDGSFDVQVEYVSGPELTDKVVILTDPMLATGGSAIDAITMLKQKGAKNIRLMCLIAAEDGIKSVTEVHPDVDIYTAAIDKELNKNGYIVPGLGDAGDRLYGTK